MANYWRYFRLDGDPNSCYGVAGELFTVKIYHGGRFYSDSGANKQYKGGEICYVDGVDPDKVSFTGFNYWTNDLGYIQGPIAYWYKIPGSEPGSGYLPVTCDVDAVDMLQFIPSSNRTLEIYIVCLAERRILQSFELEAYDDQVDHLLYIGHAIDDLEYGQEALCNEQEESRDKPSVENVGENNGPSVENVGEPNGQSVKGKQKVVDEEGEGQKKKKGRAKKNVNMRYETRFKGKCSYAEELYGSESSSSSEDPDYYELVDSDYELFDEDDEVLFETNVDGDPSKVQEALEMGYAGHISDDEDNYSDGFPSLDGSSDDDAEDTGRFKVKCKKRFSKWKEFNKQCDMKKPTFEIGMAFPNLVIFKNAVRKHAVLTRKELRFVANTRHKVSVRCKTSPGCPFWIFASICGKSSSTIYIKTLKTIHNCSEVKEKVYHCHAPFIADEYLDSFMSDEKWSREGVQNAVGRDFDMNIGFQVCYRAKKRVKKLAQGTYEDQYNLLESYAHELKKRNPGTSVWIQTDIEGDVSRFKRIYICLEALKVGWKAGCRKVLYLDGCHLKGVHKGQLLAAVGVDGNNGMYPVAYAVVEKESKDSWIWFLEFVKVDLEIYSSNHYALISDKQKGLEQAIATLFPQAEHRHCVMHLHNNFKGDGFSGLEMKQLLWAIARSTTMNQFTKAMAEMMAASEHAWKWCNDRPAKHWSRSHFQENLKCDILLNNHSESFNSSIVPARKKPILGLLEDIRTSIMMRLANRRNSGARWRCGVGPRVEKLLKKNAEWSHEYKALESRSMRFEIHGRGVACASGVISQHVVLLDKKSCSCRRWDLSGIPCAHAIAAIYSKGWSPEDFVDECYTQKTYMMAYEPMINPIVGVSEWEIKHRPMTTPLFRRQPGRPKLSRTKAPGEEVPPPGTTKLTKSFYSQINCGICGQKGHNRRTCHKQTQSINVDMEVPNPHIDVPAQNVQPPQEHTEGHHLAPQQSQSSNDNQVNNVDVNVNVNAMNVEIPMGEVTADVNVPNQSQGSSSGPIFLGRFKKLARRVRPGTKVSLPSNANLGTQKANVPSHVIKQPTWKY